MLKCALFTGCDDDDEEAGDNRFDDILAPTYLNGVVVLPVED